MLGHLGRLCFSGGFSRGRSSEDLLINHPFILSEASLARPENLFFGVGVGLMSAAKVGSGFRNL